MRKTLIVSVAVVLGLILSVALASAAPVTLAGSSGVHAAPPVASR